LDLNFNPGRPPRRISLGGKVLLGLILVVAGLPLLYVLLWGMGGLLIVADPLQPVDAIAVLSGNEKTRLQETLTLLREGYSRRVILTETEEMPSGGSSLGTVDKIITAREVGIASEAILVTKLTATSTRDEALAVLEVARVREFDSIMVVTDPYHCFRTRWLFRSIFAGSGVEVVVRPVRGHWYRSSTWWLTSAGRKATASEYFKLFFFLFGIRGD